MAKVMAPNTEFCGLRGGIRFEHGVAKCENPERLSWFRQNGYTVAEEVPVIEPPAEDPPAKSKKKAKGDPDKEE